MTTKKDYNNLQDISNEEKKKEWRKKEQYINT